MKNVDVETETSSINYRIPANDSPTCSVKLWKINAPIKAAHNDSQSQRSFPTRGEMNTTRGNFFSQRAKLEKLNFLDSEYTSCGSGSTTTSSVSNSVQEV